MFLKHNFYVSLHRNYKNYNNFHLKKNKVENLLFLYIRCYALRERNTIYKKSINIYMLHSGYQASSEQLSDTISSLDA